MTREDQLKFCKVCKNQKFDFSKGIICSITNLPAEFDTECDFYEEDSVLKASAEGKNIEEMVMCNVAGKGKRFANHLLDLVFLIIFALLFGTFLGIVMAIFTPDALSVFDEDNTLLDYFLSFVVGMIYYTVLETSTGRTVAKFITRTKVVTLTGKKPELGTIFIRSLCRFIPFEAFSVLFSDTATGWHDKISKTRVVDA